MTATNSPRQGFEIELAGATRFAEYLRVSLDGLVVPGSDKMFAAAVLFGVSMEHQRSVVHLLRGPNPAFSSAYALARPSLECYTRGIWLAHAATDGQLLEYLNDYTVPNQRQLIEAIEAALPSAGVSKLMTVYRTSWGLLCGFTHGGVQHMKRWSFEDEARPDFPDEDVRRLIGWTARVALSSAVQLASGVGDVVLAKRLLIEGKAQIEIWSSKAG